MPDHARRRSTVDPRVLEGILSTIATSGSTDGVLDPADALPPALLWDMDFGWLH